MILQDCCSNYIWLEWTLKCFLLSRAVCQVLGLRLNEGVFLGLGIILNSYLKIMKLLIHEFYHSLFVTFLSLIYSKSLIKSKFFWLSVKNIVLYVNAFAVVKQSKVFIWSSFLLYVWLNNSIYELFISLILCLSVKFHYSPLIKFKGKVYISKFIEWNLTMLLVLSISETEFSINFWYDMLSIELIYNSWILSKELQNFAEDIKKQNKTLAVLLGRHDTYRLFALFQTIPHLLILIDTIAVNKARGLALLLLPWNGYCVFLIRNMKLNKFSELYFLYLLFFSLLNILGFTL